MRIRVADYIARRLTEMGVRDVFTVTGGGAMHLNDALGKCEGLRCTYNHHEQACAMAAESYARLTGRIAAVCVTSGPGGTNAITGVLGGWQDSIPMLVISGQVKFSTTVRSTGLPLRQLGDQEFDITGCVKTMTKYAEMVVDANDLGYHLDRAFYLATHGRPGPCWLDIPLDVQGATIETDRLRVYNPEEDAQELPPAVPSNVLDEVVERIKNAERPVIMAGSGIRRAGVHDEFIALADRLGIPVVTPWNSHDNIWDNHPLYMGRPGNLGERVGNFVVQNSDLLLSIGCRLSIRQVSYNWTAFAREAYKIMVDIDPLELAKPTLSIDLPICADAGDFIRALSGRKCTYDAAQREAWLAWCNGIKDRYPILQPKFFEHESPVNPYVFIDSLFQQLPENEVITAANGSCCVITFQAAHLKKGQRLYHNSGCASMGYGLPAAIGASVATGGGRVICLEGDGSLQMNLQELMTAVHNKLPLKIFVMNNNGYHSIRQTQSSFFGQPLVGVAPDSGISFPDLSKIAYAYDIPFERVESHREMDEKIQKTLDRPGISMCEIILDPRQYFEPKLSSKRLPDGRIVSPPLEDMYPFLPREEFLSNMIIAPENEG